MDTRGHTGKETSARHVRTRCAQCRPSAWPGPLSPGSTENAFPPPHPSHAQCTEARCSMGRTLCGLTGGDYHRQPHSRGQLNGRQSPPLGAPTIAPLGGAPLPFSPLPHHLCQEQLCLRRVRRHRRIPGPWLIHPIPQGGRVYVGRRPVPFPSPLGVNHHEESQGGLRSISP